MKRLKKGPELKMPELKAPVFLADLYYDLRDRRLLPLVALVVVAIGAVPFLLGSDPEEPVLPPVASGVETGGAEVSTLTVVEATPGLRSYRKRLKGRTPSDPFQQQYTAPSGGSGGDAEEAQSSGATSGSAESGSFEPSPAPATEAEEPAGSTSPKSPSGSGGSNPPDDLDGKRLYGFRPDVRFGVAGSGKLTLYEDLPLGSLLPKKNGIVLLTGVVQSGERVLFNVAPGIVVRGDGGCVGGDANCRFLSMREGDAVDLLTGMPGEAFRLKVESIEFIALPLPPKSDRASGSSAAQPREGLARGIPQNFSN